MYSKSKAIIALSLAAYLSSGLHPTALAQQSPNIWLKGHTPKVAVDPNQPVSRGYTVVNVEPAIGGAKLIVEVFQDRVNSPVVLSLQSAVNTGSETFIVPVKLLSQGKSENNFYQKEEFFLDYNELQDYFKSRGPNAKGLSIEPGMAMFVKADFPSGHNWGGYDRGGTFFLPTPMDSNGRLMTELATRSATSNQSNAPTVRPTALDVAYPIVQEMANIFNDRTTGAGIKLEGQVRSRVEGEGKFQLTEEGYLNARELLFKLAQDPSLAQQVLGNGWSIKLEDRYMQRDASNNLILGTDGMPIPDPMVDTYYDSNDFKAAQNDMAIRYRWTEGNRTGSWNFKPGIGRSDSAGVMYRVEYGVDTTDDKPTSLSKFADSLHALNPFQIIRSVIPGAVPSEFLQPAVKIEDHRYKFKLEHVSNLAIEISADDVKAYNLRDPNANVKRFFQLEMDIDHLATASKNVVTSGTRGISVKLGYNYNSNLQPAIDTFLGQLDDKAFFDGRPVIHDATDIEANSPLLQSRKADFDMASDVISKLRDFTLGPNWRPGAQKYAFAAAKLGLVERASFSRSVQQVDDMVRKPRASAKACQNLF